MDNREFLTADEIRCGITRPPPRAEPAWTDTTPACISLSPQELTNRVNDLARHHDRIANYVQGLVQHEEYEALVAKVARLERALNLLRAEAA
jgi:hypothetical protein